MTRVLLKAACRRVAVTPPPPASRRSGGGGATAYMPGKLASGSEKERQPREKASAERKRVWMQSVFLVASNLHLAHLTVFFHVSQPSELKQSASPYNHLFQVEFSAQLLWRERLVQTAYLS